MVAGLGSADPGIIATQKEKGSTKYWNKISSRKVDSVEGRRSMCSPSRHSPHLQSEQPQSAAV